ncbi:MAG: Transcription-repair-coupling factor [Chlamydiales bacterium]|nr:Transcription-repair-coupling factor [Chlamydiales bacterium]MCH9619846.1 Transcription-repair-coupling factor [Chlamydiales bacterium]MCH9622727.1 Transcription-repair-coupling factor [Chlamydiales bacterium]
MDRIERFLKNPSIASFAKQIEEGETLLVEGLWDCPKALLAALVMKMTGQHVVFFTTSEKVLADFPYFGLKPLEFPAWENLPSEEVPPSPDIVGERYHVLQTIADQNNPQLICTSLQAVLQKVLPPEKLKPLYIEIKQGDELPFTDLPDHFASMGYHKKAVASDKGEFAVRGGIIDIYPVSSPDPCRIEFWEDEIVSIRHYDPVGQTSVKKIDSILITPAEEYEMIGQSEQLSTLFDYLGPHTLVIFDDLEALEDKYVALKSMLKKQVRTFLPFEELLKRLDRHQKVYFTHDSIEKLSEIKIVKEEILFDIFEHQLSAKRWRPPFLPLLPSLCPPDQEIEDLTIKDVQNILLETKTEATFVCSTKSEEKEIEGEIERGYLSSGLYLPEPSYALIPMTELTHRYQVRRQKQRSHYHTLPVEMLSLTPGESIVHMNNGIGRYLGIEKRPNHLGQETEYLLLEYAEGAKLYVPMEQANLVSKYIGSSETKPELHTLGSSKWQRSRLKSEQAILGYAQDLLELQADRIMKGGHIYPPDGELGEQFSKEFPYIETADQTLAIQNIKKDMESDQSMDRLICGDVGYGKTEVAMRAAFKAALGGKQVAILVPTTVLAMQHYDSFSARMANFPVNIGILSRFQKPKEIKQTLDKIAKGEIDIIVGTHRMVSKDVEFKDLGLMIIDEEQRFGVRTKESLKKLKSEVDCLSLSATPIPRTLYMSLVGARDLSVINTPPEDRLPIQSVVCQRTDDVLKNAIMRELARDGQIYVIHNRVETITKLAGQIRELVPTAKIVIAHGQMHANDLDKIFHTFKSGEADILIATSIIENGIDIPNANTILIDRSDMFGISDLYQMRGRVGRWNRKAFCYFLVNNPATLQETARKRLAALASSSGQGGGMKIAMHDLEIRGAGNILGTEQSGHVQAIGFHFYCKLLKKAVNALKNKQSPHLFTDTKIEFPFDARLPNHYINDVSLRMELYQRLGDSDSTQEVDDLIEEISDRFGTLPKEVKWLQTLSRIRVFAHQNAFTLIKLTKTFLHAEQTHGKKKKITKKLLFKLPATPEELEKELLQILKENFYLPGS